MLRDERVEFVPAWASEDHVDESGAAEKTAAPDKKRELADRRGGGDKRSAAGKHHEIDRELRRIAKQRAGLDVEEARWLREAERLNIWQKLGYTTAVEYLEDVFGHSPRTACS